MNKNDTFVDCSSSMDKSVVRHRILFVLMTLLEWQSWMFS